ncbi:MAG: hypothetical protein GVY10_10980 [Verrucomicrobia bacterium]|jgi:nitrogen fixation-related uncharacterized protein|nr:hypothetical protein [Verrucomicrobiota bacterium]
MEWGTYIIGGFIFASLFFLAAAYALHWAHKSGQLSNLEEGSRSIFDEDEPEGEITDQFPEKKTKKPGEPSGSSRRSEPNQLS